MILETARYNEADISRYIPLIESSLNSLMSIIVNWHYSVDVRI